MSNTKEKPSYAGARFENDIFVSYSHGIQAEGKNDSDLKKWTHTLIKKLKEHIGYSLRSEPRQVKVWYDEQLSGNLALTDSLKDEVESSATLLIVMTDIYLSSDWCNKEMQWFQDEIKRRGGGVENVFVVRAMPTEAEAWPDFLKDDFDETILGFQFCDESKAKAARPFGWVNPDKSSTSEEFVDSLTNLASDIATRLDEIREKSEIKRVDETETEIRRSDANWPVLVAPPTQDVKSHYQSVRKQLTDKGCTILPAEEMLIDHCDGQDLDQAFRTALAFVQLIGIIPSRDIGEETGRVQLLNSLASENALKPFIWRDNDIPISVLNHEPVYQEFVKSLGELPRQNISHLVDEVIEYLEKADLTADCDESILAYMEVPPQALQKFGSLRNDITSNDLNLLPLQPPRKGKVSEIQDQRKSRQLLYRNCKAVLLIYCIANDLAWLVSSIVNFVKDVSQLERERKQVPVPIVVDLVGEAEDLAKQLGVEVIRWDKSKSSAVFSNQLRVLVT